MRSTSEASVIGDADPRQVSDPLAYEDLSDLMQAFAAEVLSDLVCSFGDTDVTLVQLAAMYVLDGGEERTINELAERVGRSVSATSRMVEQLVARALVGRREDDHDRRNKRVCLTPQGRAYLRSFERHRATAQTRIMAYLTAEEQQLVVKALGVLVRAAGTRSAVEACEALPEGGA